MEKTKFRFRYTTLIWVLLAALFLLLAFGTAKNFYDFLSTKDIDGMRPWFSFAVSALSFLLLIITLSVAIYGKYVVAGGTLTLRIGIFSVKTDISEIVQASHFKKSDKLVLYFKNGKYSVVVIKPEEYSAFFDALKKQNPAIPFVVENEENN